VLWWSFSSHHLPFGLLGRGLSCFSVPSNDWGQFAEELVWCRETEGSEINEFGMRSLRESAQNSSRCWTKLVRQGSAALIFWLKNQKMCFFTIQEAFLGKSRQTTFSGVVFRAEHESVVCRAQKCLIRSLIKVKGQ